MGKFIEKHKVKIFVLLLIIGFLIVDDAYHKWKRSNEPYLKDTLAPYKGVEVYDINELTEEEYNKIFYGEDDKDG